MASNAFPARFAGECHICHGAIAKGDPVRWSRSHRGRVWHDACDVRTSSPSAPEAQPAPVTPTTPPYIPPTPREVPREVVPIPMASPTSNGGNGTSNAGLFGMLAESIAPYLEQRIQGLVDESKVLDIVQRALTGVRSVQTVEVHNTDTGARVDLGVQHTSFPLLLQLCDTRMIGGHHLNVWLTGPAGSGKTTAAHSVAKALGLEFYFTGSIDTEYKLLGFIDAQGRVVSPAFRKAYEHGGVFLFDECDSSLPAALLAFNAALANGSCAFPDGVVARHPDFICIAAANTWGLGATHDYVGRLKLDAAFLDRFVSLEWGYDLALEQSLSGNDTWCSRVQHLRANAVRKGLKVVISPRATYFGASLLARGMAQSTVETVTVRKGMSAEQWAAIQ